MQEPPGALRHLVDGGLERRNVRSMSAHLRIGFTVIDRYRDPTDEWALLRWDWSDPVRR